MKKSSPDFIPTPNREKDFDISSIFQTLAELRSKVTGESEFFPTLAEKKELVEMCSSLTIFLHDNKIPNLVLVDRSARPAYLGVGHLWRKNYPNEKSPDIFFVNPDSIKSGDDLIEKGGSGLPKFMEMTFKADDPTVFQTGLRDQLGKSNSDIAIEFSDAYPKLNTDRDKAVLIFDACIHSGDTVKPIKRTLETLGFEHVLTGVVSNSRDDSDLKLDFVALTSESLGFCRPFDRDKIIKKEVGSFLPVKNNDTSEVDRSVRIRREIIGIFNDAPGDWEIDSKEVKQRVDMLQRLETRKKYLPKNSTRILSEERYQNPVYQDQLPKFESWGTYDKPKKVVTFHVDGERYILDQSVEDSFKIIKDGKGLKPTSAHLEKLRRAITNSSDSDLIKYFDSVHPNLE